VDHPPIIPVWRAIFYCSYEMLVDALRHFMLRLRQREIRPLAFGFTEAGDGSTYVDFQETQREDGAFFVIKLVNWNQKTHRTSEENVGVILIYKGESDKTKAELQCLLEDYASKTDYVVEIAKHFANEAKGYRVRVESDILSTEFTRDFIVSAPVADLARTFAIFNEELKTFGYWLDLPDHYSAEALTGVFFILKTNGVNPYVFLKPSSPFWRREAGVIEYLQIKDKTRLKVYAPNSEERGHFWSYINILKEKMQGFGLIEESHREEQGIYDSHMVTMPIMANIGRPTLDRDELIYRLTKAQDAEDIKQREPEMTWKEIARLIQWRYGHEPRGVKLLEDARHRLKRPENKILVDEITLRRKEKKERE
jgi:hypothetical protein